MSLCSAVCCRSPMYSIYFHIAHFIFTFCWYFFLLSCDESIISWILFLLNDETVSVIVFVFYKHVWPLSKINITFLFQFNSKSFVGRYLALVTLKVLSDWRDTSCCFTRHWYGCESPLCLPFPSGQAVEHMRSKRKKNIYNVNDL